MLLRSFLATTVGFAILSSPASFANLAQPSVSATQTNQSVLRQSSDHYLLQLVSAVARPEPVLTAGAPVLTKDGITIGRIENIVVHRAMIQAVVSLPLPQTSQSQTQEASVEPELFLVPATAFETETGEAILLMPVENLSNMERFYP